MKHGSWIALATAALTISTNFTLPQPSQAQNKGQFFCGMSQGFPATLVRTPRGALTLIVWTGKQFKGSGWTPEQRCKEVSNRFEQFNRQGLLKTIKTGIVNGQWVICAVPCRCDPCSSSTVLLTVPPDMNARQLLDQLLNTRVGASAQPVYLSSDDEKAVKLTIEPDGNASVDLQALIEERDL